MADNITSRLSIEEVRASVERIRAQGEKLVDRLRTDAKDFITNAPKVVSIDEARKRLDDARKRAEDAVAAVRDLRTRRTEVLSDLLARAIATLGLAKTEQLKALEARIAELERRLAATQAA
jgi:uncharacterized coiled-coil protein SlyX